MDGDAIAPARNPLNFQQIFLRKNPTAVKKTTKKITLVVIALLVASVCLNVFLLAVSIPSGQNQLSALNARVDALNTENSALHAQVNTVTAEVTAREIGVSSASLQAPAVSQAVQNVIRGRRVYQIATETGTIMNISVEIEPGLGRVLVQTVPLTGVDFQTAANTAVEVADQKTGFDLTKSDVVFSITSPSPIQEVDGPSAGALMTLLMVSAMEKRPVDQSLTLTGTINADGSVGAIGGVVAKAMAAKGAGKTLFLIPAANQDIVPAQQGAAAGSAGANQPTDAKTYIENTVGISVQYVKTVDDVTAAALK